MVVGLAVLFVGKEAPRLVRELFEQKTLAYAPDTVEIRLGYWPGKMGFASTSADVQKMAGDAFSDIKSSPFFSVSILGNICVANWQACSTYVSCMPSPPPPL